MFEEEGVTLAIYVDDLAIFLRKIADIKALKKKLASKFTIKDLSDVKEKLNIHVRRDRRKNLYSP